MKQERQHAKEETRCLEEKAEQERQCVEDQPAREKASELLKESNQQNNKLIQMMAQKFAVESQEISTTLITLFFSFNSDKPNVSEDLKSKPTNKDSNRIPAITTGITTLQSSMLMQSILHETTSTSQSPSSILMVFNNKQHSLPISTPRNDWKISSNNNTLDTLSNITGLNNMDAHSTQNQMTEK